jgi:hypothetical protein
MGGGGLRDTTNMGDWIIGEEASVPAYPSQAAVDGPGPREGCT